MTGRPITGEARIRLRARAADLYVAGATIHSVRHQLGLSYGTTRTLLLEAGVHLRRPGGWRTTSFTTGT
ncbi:transcriptional regulator [Streptomyces sp. V2]|uniref:helix-turn-helix domain-containing protein n=1 Tax=Streptomyces sp. V2 TaxID=1424099 RepID=UPI000D66D8A1|nr:helix-turn-helix domain-containing protein [Streptomyces sp. V2]PWG13933.1 transcriptional regulator [Streptomyces sp. V2]